MKQTHKDIYRKAIEAYGVDNQLFQLCEEMAELMKAVNKWRRNKHLAEKYPSYVGDVVEEIADVEIMLDQLQIMLNIPHNEVYEMRCKKLDRLSERLEKGE